MKDKLFEVMVGGFGLLTTLMIAGFTFVLTLQGYTNQRIDITNNRIDALSVTVQDIDRRLSRIEGIYSVRQCHVVKEEI